MEHYSLCAEEFTFLCFASGAKKVYGLEKADAASEPEQIQKALIKKRYMKSDFDGNLTVRSELSELINVCVNCEKQLILNASTMFYCRQEEVVRLAKNQETYELDAVKAEDMWTEILCAIPKECEAVQTEHMDAILSKRELREFKATVGRTKLYALTTLRFTENQTNADSLLALFTERGTYLLKPMVRDLENVVHILSQDRDEICKRLERMKAEE